MRSLLQLGCLLVPGVFSGARAAVVFVSFEGQVLDFYGGPGSYEQTLFPMYLPGGSDATLTLSQGGIFGRLVSNGPLRVAITEAPPPNIGGKIRAMDAGSIIGPVLTGGAGWHEGEPLFGPGGVPIPGDRYHHLYDNLLTPIPSEFFKVLSYIGIEFEIDGDTHYGWYSVEVRPGDVPSPFQSQITGFAYETRPGVPIVAGAVPEPGISLLFVMGAGAFCLRRRNPSTLRDGSCPPPPNHQ